MSNGRSGAAAAAKPARKKRQGGETAAKKRPKAVAKPEPRAATKAPAAPKTQTAARRKTASAKPDADEKPKRKAAPKTAKRAAKKGAIETARAKPRSAKAASKRARPSHPSASAEPIAFIVPSLDWDDGVAPVSDALVDRWVKRGDELLKALAENGAKHHEYRADLKQGRFVWLSPEGHVSAEARAQIVCSWSRSTGVVAMAWADPLLRPVGIARIDAMPAERDEVDEEGAWHIAMQAIEACGADFLYRVPTPHAWYFLALTELSFEPTHPLFTPSTPVGLVLRGLGETRQAIVSRAEPADVVRGRLSDVGSSLLSQAEYAYRETDWVGRLERTGRRLMHLAGRVPKATFSSVAAGRAVDEWVDQEIASDLVVALALLEDEWAAFV